MSQKPNRTQQAKDLAVYCRASVRDAHTHGMTGTLITEMYMLGVAISHRLYDVDTWILKRAARLITAEFQRTGELDYVDLSDALIASVFPATGRQRIESAARAAGFTDQPDTDHGGWAQTDHVRRYHRGPRRVTVGYDLYGRVVEVWTARSHHSRSATGKAEWVVNYLRGAVADETPAAHGATV